MIAEMKFQLEFGYGLLRLPGLDIELTVSVTGRQRILTPPRHLTPPVLYPAGCAQFSDLCIVQYFSSLYMYYHFL
jgi:hypothetical protein